MVVEGLPFVWLLENLLTGAMIISYLYYEIHYGRVSRMVMHMDAIIDVVLALARESDRVDEEKVAERLNGHSPEDYINDG